MPLPVDLPVWLHNEDSINAEKIGLELPVDSGDKGVTRFYIVDNITSYPENKDYTIVSSGGNAIVVALPINIVKQRIES